MAYPASAKTLEAWAADVDRRASQLKSAAQEQKALSASGQLNMDMVRRFFDQLVQANVLFTAANSVTGIGAYITTQKQDQVADPVAEFTAMLVQVVATLNWLRVNVPQAAFNGGTYKLAFVFPADNVTPSSALTFTAGQTAGYRTALDALIATIS